jgi:esterase/lipase
MQVAALHLLAPFVTSLPKDEIDMAERWQGYPVNPLRASIELLRLQKVVRRQLTQIQQPVLVVQGQHDNVIDPECGALIMAGVSTSDTEFHMIEDAGHVILLYDAIDDITDITLRFIERTMHSSDTVNPSI